MNRETGTQPHTKSAGAAGSWTQQAHILPWSLRRGRRPAHTDGRLLAPEPRESKFLPFQAAPFVVLCGGRPRKPFATLLRCMIIPGPQRPKVIRQQVRKLEPRLESQPLRSAEPQV